MINDVYKITLSGRSAGIDLTKIYSFSVLCCAKVQGLDGVGWLVFLCSAAPKYREWLGWVIFRCSAATKDRAVFFAGESVGWSGAALPRNPNRRATRSELPCHPTQAAVPPVSMACNPTRAAVPHDLKRRATRPEPTVWTHRWPHTILSRITTVWTHR